MKKYLFITLFFLLIGFLLAMTQADPDNGTGSGVTGGGTPQGRIGNDASGQTDNCNATENQGISWSGVPDDAGPINWICYDIDYLSNATVNVALYCDDAGGCTGGYSQGDLIRDGTTLSSQSSGVQCIQLDSSYTLIITETYRVAVGAAGDSSWHMDASAGGVGGDIDTSYTVGDTMPASFDEDSSCSDTPVIWGAYSDES